MPTVDQVLIIIVSVLLSIFILLCISVTVAILKLVGSLRQIVERAEEAVESVESAAEILKDTSGRLAFFKLIRNIMKMMQNNHRKK